MHLRLLGSQTYIIWWCSQKMIKKNSCYHWGGGLVRVRQQCQSPSLQKNNCTCLIVNLVAKPSDLGDGKTEYLRKTLPPKLIFSYMVLKCHCFSNLTPSHYQPHINKMSKMSYWWIWERNWIQVAKLSYWVTCWQEKTHVFIAFGCV